MAHISTDDIPFPHHDSISTLSMVATKTTALDICYSVYGDALLPPDTVDQFYEANATYENPVLTATSRSVIGDIHRLSRNLSSVDVPRPLAVLCTLFRLRPPENTTLFQALRVWTDVVDICESESFDGHRKAIVEHTLNILLLPGLHTEGHLAYRLSSSSDSLVNINSPGSTTTSHPFTVPSLPVPGTSLSIPSPLHLKLHIVTRLSFNEQGLVTHHRDIWDVKDVVGLVPGVSLAQWIGTRLAATGLSYLSRLWAKPTPSKEEPGVRVASSLDIEHGP